MQIAFLFLRVTGCIPASRRGGKKDFADVTPDEADRMRGEPLRLPLATYCYKGEDEHVRPRLSVVVEDATPNACVDARGGDRVDLFGCTSLTVAALQSQERELSALRAEVLQLRAEVAKGQRSGGPRTLSIPSDRGTRSRAARGDLVLLAAPPAVD